MLAGERVNVTEDRAVLHTALRLPRDAELVVDGQDVVADVHEVLDRVYAFAEQVRSGEWTGATGEPMRTVVNIGIGGSDLGPVMAYEALRPYAHDGIECRFISNIDPTRRRDHARGARPGHDAVHRVQQDLRHPRDADQRPSVPVLAARRARRRRRRAPTRWPATSSPSRPPSTRSPTSASTPRTPSASGTGSAGRYSLDSAIGTSLVDRDRPGAVRRAARGHARRRRALPHRRAGAHNVPLLMGLLNIWYTSFLGAETHAVLPYAQLLHRFPAYLQQLTMESNGKGVRWDGTEVTTDTGEVFWGEPGTNGQHAFYQLIHQGTRLVPADFIAVAEPGLPAARRRPGRPRAVPGQLLRPDPGAGLRQDRRRGPRRGHRGVGRPGAGLRAATGPPRRSWPRP